MRGKTKRKDFNGFETLVQSGKNRLFSDGALNCDCSNGRLRRGLGSNVYALNGRVLTLPSGTGRIATAYLAQKKVAEGQYTDVPVCVDESGNFLFYLESSKTFKTLQKGMGRVKIIDFTVATHTPVTLVVGESGVWRFDPSIGLLKVGAYSTLPCGCVAAHRLWTAIAPYTILYSEALNPANFTLSMDDSGRLYLPKDAGKIVDLAAYRDKVYVFFERGICKISPAGAAREFSVTSLPYGGGRIFGGSVGEAGNSLAFLTEDGAYLFDGAKARKIIDGKALGLGKETICSCARCEDKYVVRYVDENDEWRGLVIDGAAENGYAFFVCEGLTQSQGRAVFVLNGRWFVLDGTGNLPVGEESRFIACAVDFGQDGNKGLRKLVFQGRGSFVVRVSSKGERQAQRLNFVNGRAETLIGLAGECFDLEIFPENDCEIRCVRAEYSCAKEGV